MIILPDPALLDCEVNSASLLCADGVGDICLGKRTMDSTILAAELKIRDPVPLDYCGLAMSMLGYR